MRRLILLLVAALSFVAPARAQDPGLTALKSASIYMSPSDIAAWPETVRIRQIDFQPASDKGVAISTSDIPSSWDFHVPAWGRVNEDKSHGDDRCRPQPAFIGDPDGYEGDNGCIAYTVWIVARIDGAWHAAGLQEMWRGRIWTGAPIIAQFRDWAYADRGWGPLATYQPNAGDQIGFFISAGQGRLNPKVTSVRERSNVVMVTLPVGDVGVVYSAPPDGHITTIDAPPTPIQTPLPSGPGVDMLLTSAFEHIRQLEARVTALEIQYDALKKTVDSDHYELWGGYGSWSHGSEGGLIGRVNLLYRTRAVQCRVKFFGISGGCYLDAAPDPVQ